MMDSFTNLNILCAAFFFVTLFASLLIPTVAKAETIWLIITKTQAMEKIEMRDMEQCKAMGEYWRKNATSFTHWVCLTGK